MQQYKRVIGALIFLYTSAISGLLAQDKVFINDSLALSKGCKYQYSKGLVEITDIKWVKDESQSVWGDKEYEVSFKFIGTKGYWTSKEPETPYMLVLHEDKFNYPPTKKYLDKYHVKKGSKHIITLYKRLNGICEPYFYESEDLPNDINLLKNTVKKDSVPTKLIAPQDSLLPKKPWQPKQGALACEYGPDLFGTLEVTKVKMVTEKTDDFSSRDEYEVIMKFTPDKDEYTNIPKFFAFKLNPSTAPKNPNGNFLREHNVYKTKTYPAKVRFSSDVGGKCPAIIVSKELPQS